MIPHRNFEVTRNKTGIALLMVLGVLALLSVMALTFVSLSRLERAVSRNYVDRVRCVMVAESGVEYAIARLQGFTGGTLSAADTQALRYKPYGAVGASPSFATPVDIGGDGLMDQASGVVSSTHVANGDYFWLQVDDCSGKLNLNDSNGKYNIDTDPRPDSVTLGAGDDTDIQNSIPRLTKILEQVVFKLFNDYPLAVNVASTVFAKRSLLPGDRFNSMRQVREILVDTGILSAAQFDTLSRQVTLWSWQDPDVLRPTYKLNLTVPDNLRAGIPQNAWDNSWDLYLYFDWQTRGFELEPRCPVNVNTASVELLGALLAPIQGWYLYEGPAEQKLTRTFYAAYYLGSSSYCYDDQTFPNPSDKGRDSIFGSVRISSPLGNPGKLAVQIRDRINGADSDGDGYPTAGAIPDPFGSWEEFENFLHLPALRTYIEPTAGYVNLMDPSIPAAHQSWYTSYFHEIYIDLILANFNPNSRLNDYNPDRHLLQHVDKAQLSQYTTELCFEPTGMFEISSQAFVEGENRVVLSSHAVATAVELWKLYRVTSQAQFMEGFDPVSHGLSRYFSPNTTGFFATAGAGLDGNRGYTIQSYPEPVLNHASYFVPPTETDRNYLDDSRYDGYLALASQRIRETECVTEPRFLCNYDTTLKPQIFHRRSANMDTGDQGIDSYYLDLATDDVQVRWTNGQFSVVPQTLGGFFIAQRRRYRLSTNQPNAGRLTHASNYSALPGNLHPDGALSDAGRTLSYPMVNIGRNFAMYGTLEFWMKPNYDPAISNRPRGVLSYMPQRDSVLNLFNCAGMWYYPIRNCLKENTSVWTVPGSSAGFEPGPTHTLAFGWWDYDWSDALELGRVSETANHTFPGHSTQPATEHGVWPNVYNFESHEWTHILVSWDKWSHPGLSNLALIAMVKINNQSIGNNRYWSHGDAQIPSTTLHNFWINDPDNYCRNYFRFGEFAGTFEFVDADPLNTSGIHGAAAFRNWSMDATVADVVGYADGPYDYQQYAASGAYVPTTFSDNYRFGRYLAQPDAQDTVGRYLAPAKNLFAVIPMLAPHDTLIPRSVTWTLYWPRQNRDAANANKYLPVQGVNVNGDALDSLGTDSIADDPLAEIMGWTQAWDPVSVDIAVNQNDGNGDQWIYGNQKIKMATSSAGWDFRRHTQPANPNVFRLQRGTMFRFCVEFNLATGQFLYQSPTLDDITFTFALAKPRVLFWEVKL